MMLEELVVGTFIVLALFELGLHLRGVFSRTKVSHCGGCSGCSEASSCGKTEQRDLHFLNESRAEKLITPRSHSGGAI